MNNKRSKRKSSGKFKDSEVENERKSSEPNQETHLREADKEEPVEESKISSNEEGNDVSKDREEEVNQSQVAEEKKESEPGTQDESVKKEEVNEKSNSSTNVVEEQRKEDQNDEEVEVEKKSEPSSEEKPKEKEEEEQKRRRESEDIKMKETNPEKNQSKENTEEKNTTSKRPRTESDASKASKTDPTPQEEVSKILEESAMVNSKRIEDQFKTLEALEYSKSLYSVFLNFNTTREESLTSYNFYINYVLSALGPTHQSDIQNKNFFHYLVEAFLLEVYVGLKKTLNAENLSYKNIAEIIRTTNITQKSFLRTLEFLTETLNYSDTLFDTGIFNPLMYNNNMSIIKRTLSLLGPEFFNIAIRLRETTNIFADIKENLTKAELENLVMELMLLSVNHTLNKLESREANQDFIDAMKSFVIRPKTKSSSKPNTNSNKEEIDTENDKEEQPYTLENYIKRVTDISKNSNVSHEENEYGFISSRISSCESFYYFSLNTFNDLNRDIDSFTAYSNSITQKVKILVKQKYRTTREFIFNVVTSSGLKVKEFGNTVRLGKLVEFGENVLKNGKQLATTSFNKVVVNLSNAKQWLDSGFLHEVKKFPEYSYEKVVNAARFSQKVLNDYVVEPTKEIRLYVTESGVVKVVVGNINSSKEKILAFRDYVRNKLSSCRESVNETVTPIYEEMKQTVKVVSDEQYISFSFNLRAFEKQRSGLAEFISNLNNYIRNKLKETKENVTKKVESVKHALSLDQLKKYLNFLSPRPSSKEKKEEETIEVEMRRNRSNESETPQQEE